MHEPAFQPLAPVKDLLADLRRVQAPTSAPSVGEVMATIVLACTPEQLTKAMRSVYEDGPEVGDHGVDMILAAQKSLKERLALVDAAIDRMMWWDAVEEANEGDNANG